MALITLLPNEDLFNEDGAWTLQGGSASFNAALADTSDGTYAVTDNAGAELDLGFGTFTIPGPPDAPAARSAGRAQVRSVQAFLRTSTPSTSSLSALRAAVAFSRANRVGVIVSSAERSGISDVIIDASLPAASTTPIGPWEQYMIDSLVIGFEKRYPSDAILRVYRASLQVVTNEAPVPILAPPTDEVAGTVGVQVTSSSSPVLTLTHTDPENDAKERHVVRVFREADYVAGQMLTANESSIEADDTGWTARVGSSKARSTAQARDGVASLLLTRTDAATGPAGAVLANRKAATPGQHYVESAWFRPSTTGRWVRLIMQFWTSGGAFISARFGPWVAEVAGTWVSASVSGWAPANAATVDVVLDVAGVPQNEAHHVDLIQAVPFDPDSAAAFWEALHVFNRETVAKIAVGPLPNGQYRAFGTTADLGSGGRYGSLASSGAFTVDVPVPPVPAVAVTDVAGVHLSVAVTASANAPATEFVDAEYRDGGAAGTWRLLRFGARVPITAGETVNIIDGEVPPGGTREYRATAIRVSSGFELRSAPSAPVAKTIAIFKAGYLIKDVARAGHARRLLRQEVDIEIVSPNPREVLAVQGQREPHVRADVPSADQLIVSVVLRGRQAVDDFYALRDRLLLLQANLAGRQWYCVMGEEVGATLVDLGDGIERRVATVRFYEVAT